MNNNNKENLEFIALTILVLLLAFYGASITPEALTGIVALGTAYFSN
ncbi:hypothetical protein [Pseudoalteromonas sp. 2CM28B]|nr:hypothetical protein [Pseudoalteromonas sp. 2CM28B]MCK8137312.1 hypothetical protein [Pseudoalteromonas sp. 2CM28B]